MQYQTFVVTPVTGEGQEELNQFLRSNRVASIEKHFVDKQVPQWHFCVEFLASDAKTGTEKRPRIDYREVLNDEELGSGLQNSILRRSSLSLK